MAKKNTNLGTAVWVDEVGSIKFRVFTVVSKNIDKTLTIDFGNNEKYNVDEKNIRAKRCVIYKTPEGKIIVQNPDNWKNIDLKSYQIKEIRFNLQNISLQEGRAARKRWTLPDSLANKLMPLFKLLFICIVIGVLGYFALKFTGIILSNINTARLQDCASILPKIPSPISSPLGVNVTS